MKTDGDSAVARSADSARSTGSVGSPETRRTEGWARTARALGAELAATALLVWLGLGSLLGEAHPPLAAPAFAFGGAVAALAAAFGPASGAHMNPAVSLAAALLGGLTPLRALGYVLAQLAGATLGAAAALATAPALAQGSPGGANGTAPAQHPPACAGCTVPAPDVSAPAAVALEAALTGVLVLALCAAWDEHARAPARPDRGTPLRIGIVVAGLVFAGGATTGASLNPARSFAPALLQNHWADHWVYWLGPLGGAALAALLHRFVLRDPPAPARALATAPEEMPLSDKAAAEP